MILSVIFVLVINVRGVPKTLNMSCAGYLRHPCKYTVASTPPFLLTNTNEDER